jgi:hypothetical protein
MLLCRWRAGPHPPTDRRHLTNSGSNLQLGNEYRAGWKTLSPYAMCQFLPYSASAGAFAADGIRE